jgi:hypothetical protein
MSFRAIIDNDGPGRVKYSIQHFSDIRPSLELAAQRRELEEAHLNKKNEIRPQATLDWTVVFAIRQKYGIDPLKIRPDQEAKFWQILQTEYPRCLTTNKKVYRAPKKREKIVFDKGTLG